MTLFQRLSMASVLIAGLCGGVAQAAGDVIRIGEINSYKAQAAYLDPYRKGWELALEQINAAGGVNGKKVEVVWRDDGANPGDAVRNAEDLVTRENVDLLMGGFLSHVGVALADYAKQRKILFLASHPLSDRIVWQGGNRYTFRLRASTYMQAAMLAPEAAKMKKKRWALIYPNYEYGQSAAATFKNLLKQAQPDVEFVAEQAPPLGKVDAGAIVQALGDAKPDAIFNVLFGADLAKFVREGTTRGLFKDREVVSLLSGEPEYLDPLRDEAPVNWLVTGYPWYAIDLPQHKEFRAAYEKKFKDYPRIGSVIGYTALKAAVAAVAKAGSTDTEKLIAAMSGLEFDSPFGKARFRPQDHQSTLGAFIGRTAVKDGKGIMQGAVYLDGAKYQPSDEEVRKLRPESK